jgi:hypothetical protein
MDTKGGLRKNPRCPFNCHLYIEQTAPCADGCLPDLVRRVISQSCRICKPSKPPSVVLSVDHNTCRLEHERTFTAPELISDLGGITRKASAPDLVLVIVLSICEDAVKVSSRSADSDHTKVVRVSSGNLTEYRGIRKTGTMYHRA